MLKLKKIKSHCENLHIRMYAGETKNQGNYLKGLFTFCSLSVSSAFWNAHLEQERNKEINDT